MSIFAFVFLFTIIIFVVIIANPHLTLENNFASFVLNVISIQPIAIPLLFAAFTLYISYRISLYRFTRKDIQ